ncbi:N-acetyltransferase [Devosia yakushimensis]|uniref:N-acetyltransferase n=1 Tax=Devosia yakushimensis TaxID=470028 RepID=A0ABQ5UK85_9HYPH|nr:GNAT family protein [Devosia yakushimensis]GLQ12245.1 N-acetyltransferase [Devosia yakushimensis]
MSYSVRRLTRDDVPAYRAIRLEALTNHPEAFASTAEQFLLRSVEDLESLLEKLSFFGAVTPDGSLVGIMAFDQGAGREAHRGWLLQVYVKPDMRGSGCSRALLEAVVTHAKSTVKQLHLAVATHNEPALRLYQKAGFTIYGTDPRFQFVNGRYVDEHMMVRFLDREPAQQQGTTESDKK